MNISPKHLFYFTNGSIGDFLMVLFFSKIVLEDKREICVHIITPRNKKLFEELALKYPVKIHECNSRSFSGIWGCFTLLDYFFSRNLVITPSTGGRLPIHTKLLACMVSVCPGSVLVGFDDGARYNKHFYDRIYDFDQKLLYPEIMTELAQDLGFDSKQVKAELSFKDDDSVLNKLNLAPNSYFILHPYGSSKKRSLYPEEIHSVIEIIKKKDQAAKIVITGSKKDFTEMKDDPKILNVAGKLSIGELVAIIKNSQGYIGVDTGITHLASMIGKKSLVISHEASIYSWLPYYNQNARILYSIKNCPHDVHEGQSHLKECYNEETNYLQKVPFGIIESSLSTFL